MKRKITSLTTAIIVLFLMLITLPETVWGQTRTKITAIGNIESGKNYYIGATTGETDYYLSADGSNAATVSGTAVTSKAEASVFTFTGSGSSWTIQFSSGNYMSLSSSKNNGKVVVQTTSASWTAANQSSLIRLSNNSHCLQKNSSGSQFGSYGHNGTGYQTDIWLEEVASDPVINANNITINASSTSGTINYKVNYPITGGKISAAKTTDINSMITNITVTDEDSDDNTIVLTTNENTSGSEKTAVVTITYTYGAKATKTKAVTITQKPYYTVSIADGITNGSVAVDKTSCDPGETVTLTPTPSSGYILSSYTITKYGGGEVDYEGNQFTMPEDNVTVDATFAPKHTLSFSTSNGTISVNGASGSTSGSVDIGEGVTATIIATPTVGYAFSTWAVTGTGASVTSATSASTTFTMGSADAELTATFIPAYSIDFESALGTYTDWEFNNIVVHNSAITAHGGSKWGSNGDGESATTTAYIKTKSKIANPGTFKCYVSKESTNATSSTWKIQTSTDGSIWTDRKSQNATSMEKGSWVEVTQDLSSYNNVYVRVYYTGSNAYRAIDDISLSYTPAPKHTLAVASVEHITIKATVSASDITEGNNAEISEGSTVAVSCTGYDDGYRFNAWDVYKTGTPATKVTVTDGSFTMPAYDVTVSATTEETRTITYSVNGNTIASVVDKGTTIDPLPIPSEEDTPLESVSVPAGYEFIGWTDDEAELDDEDLIEDYTANTNATFYAVLKKSNKITIVPSDFENSYPSEKNYDIKGISFKIKSVANYSGIQFKASEGFLYNNESLNISSIVMTRSGSYKVDVTVGDAPGSTTTTLSPSTDGSVDTYTITDGSKYVRFEKKSSNAAKYTSIVLNLSSSSTSRYTRVVPETITEATEITEPTYIASGSVVNAGAYLTCDDPSNLILEDGAQLIITNTDVQATVKSHILAATAKVVSNWYLISSPVEDPTLSTATNLTAGTYDFFRYNEKDGKWENQKTAGGGTGFTAMQTGRGYLYRNAVAMDITYQGEINVSASQAVTISGSGDLQGFNLIGNPYTHDIYKGTGTAIPNSKTDDYTLGTGFYTLKSDGTWDTGTDNTTAIQPGQGLLVKASKAGTIVIGNTNAKASAKSNNDNIMFKVENSEYTDVAYAWFDKGVGLDKINHRNADAPMLYINQDGVNYGIATMSDDTKSFNLNFKAMTMDQYTLSYKAKGEFNYLHIIDRLTGEDVDMLLDGEYSFIATPNDKDNRFIVKLGYIPNNSASDDDLFAYQSGNDIVVTGEGELQIFDVTGRMVATQRINGVGTINVSSLGVYIFKLNEKIQKIVVR